MQAPEHPSCVPTRQAVRFGALVALTVARAPAGRRTFARQRAKARPSIAMVGRPEVPRLVIVRVWVPAARRCETRITR